MSVSTLIDSAKGVVSTNNASGITLGNDSNNSGFGPFTTGIVRAITSLVTLSAGDAGVLTISGSSAVTAVMPDPTTCAGAEFTVRSLSASAHVLSGSGVAFANSGSTGAKLTLAASVGASVAVKSDGLQFLVLGSRGLYTLA